MSLTGEIHTELAQGTTTGWVVAALLGVTIFVGLYVGARATRELA